MKASTALSWFASLLLLPALCQALDPPKPHSQDKPAAAKPGQPRELTWDDLLPAAERDAPPLSSQSTRPLFDDESGPPALQAGSTQTNQALNGQIVKLPGFVVPLAIDAKSRVSEFLLVPYFGACLHVPPPPPNQIVHVTMAQPMRLESMYDPVWIIGKLSTQGVSSELANAAYAIAGLKTEKYEYD